MGYANRRVLRSRGPITILCRVQEILLFLFILAVKHVRHLLHGFRYPFLIRLPASFVLEVWEGLQVPRTHRLVRLRLFSEALDLRHCVTGNVLTPVEYPMIGSNPSMLR